ncbi:MAG: P-loop NTPase [candidate division WOR-3 bacterium]
MIEEKTKIILFLSNKGGTGKSTMLANIAYLFSTHYNKKVGVIDMDFYNPDLPSIFGVENRKMGIQNKKLLPVKILSNLYLASYGFFITDKKLPVILRGVQEKLITEQFVVDTDWSDFDYIFVDFPASFSDGGLTLVDRIKRIDGALIITSSQDITLIDTERSIIFANQYNIPILGVVENMINIVCPNCKSVLELYRRESLENLLSIYNVEIIERIPFDRNLLVSVDLGIPFIEKFKDSQFIEHFKRIGDKIIEKVKR